MSKMVNPARQQVQSPAQAGLACPRCGGVVGRTTFILHCGTCGEHSRELPDCRYEPAPAGALPHEQEAPPKGAWWIGHVKLDDGNLYPVAAAPTLGECWEMLSYYPASAAKFLHWTLPAERTGSKPTGVAAR